jgi:hypothetical protein
MVLQSLVVRLLFPLQNLDNNRRKAFAVEIYFLVIRDLADIAFEEKVSKSSSKEYSLGGSAAVALFLKCSVEFAHL